MALVKVGTKHQVVIPKAVFTKLGLAPGDYVEITAQKDQAVIKQKKIVDNLSFTDEVIGPKTQAAIRRAFKEIKAGKGHGPFKNADELIADLHRRAGGAK